eukprot:TRINITY_DN627_c0_g5_i1.p1 TRINITY_DN627_c0_g5~~TRINITY_DN627_c0_g5_i1.p1  ORF type:complete len:165 (+),score=1.76 TRINITY_DN627_c0_g5_i1:88-582(+)
MCISELVCPFPLRVQKGCSVHCMRCEHFTLHPDSVYLRCLQCSRSDACTHHVCKDCTRVWLSDGWSQRNARWHRVSYLLPVSISWEVNARQQFTLGEVLLLLSPLFWETSAASIQKIFGKKKIYYFSDIKRLYITEGGLQHEWVYFTSEASEIHTTSAKATPPM